MPVSDWIVPLVTLTVMEIVLGIDNVVFIAILVGRLPPEKRKSARRIGLALALLTRLALLFTLRFLQEQTTPLFSLTDYGFPAGWIVAEANEISWRDIVLILGGLFLIGKSTFEIHDKLEGSGESAAAKQPTSGYVVTLIWIAILDIVFSLDSVITAVGMAQDIWVMVLAMIIAMFVMLVAAGPISDFVHKHPTIKILALSFLILIGVLLLASGFDQEVNKGYIYFAMAFSLVVELLNLRLRTPAKPVELKEPQPPPQT